MRSDGYPFISAEQKPSPAPPLLSPRVAAAVAVAMGPPAPLKEKGPPEEIQLRFFFHLSDPSLSLFL
jgi:hypothetical protein